MSVVSIGPHALPNPLILAPMAGVTDQPFRRLCRHLGAGLTVSEMVTCDTRLWNSRKSRLRLQVDPQERLRVAQLTGTDPKQLAQAAQLNVQLGAQIIDLNLGCPAKKVCSKLAGSALMRDEPLVRQIFEAVIAAVSVPVTVKMRTGWNAEQRNAPAIAQWAEQTGLAAVSIHGRTRADGYSGQAEYDTIAQVKQQLSIPVFANGDIDSPEKAHHVLQQTGVDGLLIGRAALGRPWIFREILHYLNTGQRLPPPSLDELENILCQHLQSLHEFYGPEQGVRIARKHVSRYLHHLPGATTFCQDFNQVGHPLTQHHSLQIFFSQCRSRPQSRAGDSEAAV